MRLLIIPFILVAILVQTPATALGNNQEAAERIAAAIGSGFPDADIEVAFRGGQVWLRGEAVSQDQRRRIIEHVRNTPGVNAIEDEDIRIVAPRAAQAAPRVAHAIPPQTQRPPASTLAQAPMPVPNVVGAGHRAAAPPPPVAADAGQFQPQMHPQMQMQQLPPQSQAWVGAMLPAHPQQHFPSAFGVHPAQMQQAAQPSGHPFMPIPMAQHPSMQQQQHQAMMQQQMMQQAMMHQHMMQQQMMHGHHGGMMPGQFNHHNLPDYAWPSYAAHPNFAQVSYPRSYSPSAWPYIGPFYPYPQVPLGWRKVTLEHSNGWWWLDFDDGTASGPFSALFRHSTQFRY